MNLVNYEAPGLKEAYAAVRKEAERLGVEIAVRRSLDWCRRRCRGGSPTVREGVTVDPSDPITMIRNGASATPSLTVGLLPRLTRTP